jgi:tetratricopeptide (TPR) repeat protein
MRLNLKGMFMGFLFIPGIITSREVTLLDSLEAIVEHSQGEERIRILNILSEEHLLINPVTARDFAMSALEEAERLDLTGDILLSYRNIGLSFLQREQYDSALCFFKASFNKAGSSGDDRLISSALNGLGIYYTGIGMYDSALYFFDQSIIMAGEDDLTEQLAMNYLGKGLIFRKQGELSNAVEYYNLTLDLLDTAFNEEVLLEVYKELGEFYLSASDIVNARESLLSGLEMAESLRSEGRIAFLCYRLGYIHTRLGEESQALDYLERSQALLMHHGEKHMLSEVWSIIRRLMSSGSNRESIRI